MAACVPWEVRVASDAPAMAAETGLLCDGELAMIGKIIAGYLGIGLLVLAGPGRVEVQRQTGRLRPSRSSLQALLGQQAMPKWAVVAFGVTLTLALVLLWPVFLASWFQERRRGGHGRELWENYLNQPIPRGLTFARMGGAGTIFCKDCGYEEEITSFTHGYTAEGKRCGTFGHQCQSCGKFSDVDDHGVPLSATALRCECGGQLEREEVLFCPKCRSTNLGYNMEYIT